MGADISRVTLTCSVCRGEDTVCAETGDGDATKLLLERIIDVTVNTNTSVRITVGIILIFEIVTMIQHLQDYY